MGPGTQRGHNWHSPRTSRSPEKGQHLQSGESGGIVQVEKGKMNKDKMARALQVLQDLES